MTRLRLLTALLLATACQPLLAQSRPSLDQRVDKVEKELRAVQRKVFPGGSPAFFEPEIAPQAAPAPGGVPANAPLNELTERVDALEKTVAQLTGQIEQDEHRLTLLSQQAAKDHADLDARLKALEASAAAAATPVVAAPPPPEDIAPPPGRPGRPGSSAGPMARGPGGTSTSKSAAASRTPPPRDDDTASTASAAGADASGDAGGDAGEDAYMAAYRLWADKKYSDAETALKAFVAKYPKHKRTSYAQNLLGRAYLDDNRPANAAEAFAANYQTNPRGDRAQDSLYYLGQSLMKLNKPADACRVYDELDAAYGDKVADSLRTRVAAARKDAKCK